MARKFRYVYEKWSPIMGGDGKTGTIRTEPENYYVATVDKDLNLTFEGIEANTRDVDREEVKSLWEGNRIRLRIAR
jgi:hypothetical protein